MYIEYAKTARMSQTGSSLLRAIQNNTTPTLDLLVRESIQNSLDASNGQEDFVSVDFNTGEFNSNELADNLEEITLKLKNRYKKNQMFIAIEDYHTKGLTGPMNYNDVRNSEYGNLIKLVYEISKPQNQEGAGGSWGLGKTVYFRVGIGLVLYYSRIKTRKGNYESRLAACLVEDEKKEDALLKRPSINIERGIAWWGDKINGMGTETQPITNLVEIRKILDIFNLKEYSGDKTGTLVIIPYISPEDLLKELHQEDISNNKNKPFWVHSIEDYLQISLQKWYHPRILNTNYKYGKYLRTKINNVEITKEKFYPYFRIMQDLYNCALNGENEMASFPHLKAQYKKIELRNVFSKGKYAGTLAHIEVDEDILRMLPPDNLPSPYTFINLFHEDENSNSIILGYTRRTGMIVSYEIMGPWTDNTPKSEDGKYILAFFVLNSLNELKIGNKPYSLEEYVRKGEQADHTSWSDWSLSSGNPFIINKIQGHVRKALVRNYKVVDQSTNFVEDKGMGREFAKYLLPPTGYGKGSSATSTTVDVEPKKIKSKKNSIHINKNPKFENGNIIFNFDLNISKYKNPVAVTVKAITELMGMTADEWEKEDSIGNQFPIKIKAYGIRSLKVDDLEIVHPTEYVYQEVNTISPLKVKYIRTKRFNQRYGLEISMQEKRDANIKIKGELICTTLDAQMKIGIDLLGVK